MPTQTTAERPAPMPRFASLRRVYPALADVVVEGYNETLAYGRSHWADSSNDLREYYRALLRDAVENVDGLSPDDEEAIAGAWACGRDLACARMEASAERRRMVARGA